MADAVTSARLRLVYPELKVLWFRVAEDMRRNFGAEMRVAESLRTFQYQADLYAQGRTKPGRIVTWSLPGDSLHHYGLAVDSCFLTIENKKVHPYLDGHPRATNLWTAYVSLAKAHGFEPGGLWKVRKDLPHLQRTYGLQLAEIKELYRFGGLTAVWTEIDKARGLKVGGEWYGPQASARVLNPQVAFG